MRKLAVALGLAVAAALGSIAAVGAADGGEGKVLRLTGHLTDDAMVPGPDGLVGTRFVGFDEVSIAGGRVGTAAKSCEAVAAHGNNTGTFQCLITIGLPQGTITLQAMPRLSENGLEDVKAAVTGGTGSFREARGEALVKEVSPEETSYSVTLR